MAACVTKLGRDMQSHSARKSNGPDVVRLVGGIDTRAHSARKSNGPMLFSRCCPKLLAADIFLFICYPTFSNVSRARNTSPLTRGHFRIAFPGKPAEPNDEEYIPMYGSTSS